MNTKTVYITKLCVPNGIDFKMKYYWLITLLLFEYKESDYYQNNLEISGFNERESDFLCMLFPTFEQDSQIIKVEYFDSHLLDEMISFLPADKKELLTDHIVLSLIGRASDYELLSSSLKYIFDNSEYLPSEYFSGLDFGRFFKGEESSFMNEYYPSENLKDEIRVQYGLKHRG